MRVSSICLGPLATNCYLIETTAKRVLVDPAESSDQLFSFAGDRAIDIVVLTHGHFDHIGGAWAFDRADIMLHEADLPLVDHAYPDHPPIDAYLCEGDEIVPGLSVLHTPGHSPGSVVLRCDEGLIVGDLLFQGSIGRTDLPGGVPRDMLASLKRIVELKGDAIVYPGHGPTTTLQEERRSNPYLLML